ncbi:membrane protein, putative [Indibacter alkaliphilus LW1]|uniref:Membrane protein, putative n=1 Tax=Indibacter alkaliphilus (strain CCUG 57479 / KCTC 22604 / LW1) TaxID=1189612 RepID=S2DJS0_INDAL|nr:DUF4271 domain-containing protein [Indibacter alkaliphilus]EOZ92236.1 membrane protein, putative [Indibacter alkaliphilus LW1]
MKRTVLLLTLFFVFAGVQAQVIENYDSKIRENHSRGWLRSTFTSGVTLDVGNFPKSSFRFVIPAGTTIFMNDKLWFYSEQDTVKELLTSELKSLFANRGVNDLEFTALNEGNNLDKLSIKKGFFAETVNQTDGNQVVVFDLQRRSRSDFSDFYLTGIVIVLFLAAVFKVIFPLLLTYFTSLRTLVTAEDFSDTGAFQKFFSIDVLFYLLMLSMLLMLNIMIFGKVFETPIFKDIVNGDLNSLFFYWTLGSVVIVLGFILKFIFLKILVSVFDLGKYEFPHFFYLLRLLSIALFLISLCLTYFYLNNQSLMLEVVKYALWAFFWVYLVGVLALFVIMVNRVPFKNYHLFAYICTAELIPFLIISKMVIG